MPISDLRFTKVFDEIINDKLSEGKVINPILVEDAIRDLRQQMNFALPFMQLRRQPAKSNFSIDKYNDSINEVVDDISVLYDHLVEVGGRVLNDLNRNEIEYRKFLNQIRVIDDSIENLLLVSQKTNNFFAGVFDFFRDSTKIDQAQTTAKIDISQGAVLLNKGRKANLKYKLSHLSNNQSGVVKISDRVQSDIDKNAPVTGSMFSYMFDDLATSWQNQIVTSVGGPMTVEFTFPITDGLGEVPINLIEIDPASNGETSILALHSFDGINFSPFGSSQDAKLMDFDKVTFSTVSVNAKFIKIVMKKDEPDGEISRTGRSVFEYVFGISNISLAQNGYKDEGQIISRELFPDTDLINGSINAISLETQEEIPADTGIKYFMAPGNDPDKFIQIEPLNRDSSIAPKLIDFGSKQHSTRQENFLEISSSPTFLETKNGISFYNIFNVPNSPIFNSSKLWRGVNSFQIDKKNQIDRKTVRNNYIEFTADDRQIPLYLTNFDESSLHPASDGSNDTSLTMRNFILEAPNIVPVDATAPLEQPDWSILSVIRFKSDSGFNGTTGTITVDSSTADRQVSLTDTSIPLNVGGYVYLSYIVGSKTISGYFKVLSNNGIAIIVEDTTFKLLNSTANTVTFEAQSEDITNKVKTFSGKLILIDSTQEILIDDKVIVTYRSALQAKHSLITSSIKVTNAVDETVIYRLGQDYQINRDSGTISRNKDGNISIRDDQASIAVRVDFEYNETADSNFTYTTYLQVESDNPVRIRHSGIEINEDEAVFIDTFKGLIEISSETDLPELEKGYHKLVVRSKSITDDDGNIDATSALYKVMSLVDVDGDIIFQPGKYFLRLISFIQPVKETSLFNLQRSIRLEDRTSFAIDRSSDSVIINFDPTDSDDLLYVKAATIPVIKEQEDFEFEYDYNLDVDLINSLIFKAILTRDASTSGDLTPRLFGYHIKIS